MVYAKAFDGGDKNQNMIMSRINNIYIEAERIYYGREIILDPAMLYVLLSVDPVPYEFFEEYRVYIPTILYEIAKKERYEVMSYIVSKFFYNKKKIDKKEIRTFLVNLKKLLEENRIFLISEYVKNDKIYELLVMGIKGDYFSLSRHRNVLGEVIAEIVTFSIRKGIPILAKTKYLVYRIKNVLRKFVELVELYTHKFKEIKERIKKILEKYKIKKILAVIWLIAFISGNKDIGDTITAIYIVLQNSL